MSFRSVLSLLLAGVLFALGAGCARKRETAVDAGNRDKILHVGNLVEPSDLDPQVINSQQDAIIAQALFEGLCEYDPKTCVAMPAMAERWEVAADNLTWTFRLRRNGKWSNGDAVTAHDFVFAFRRILTPSLASEYASMLYVLKNAHALNSGKLADFTQLGARAADDYTLVLTLDHPAPYLPNMACSAAWYPVHRATIEKFNGLAQRGSAWTRPGNHVSNGYFRLVEWLPHQRIRVEKNPHYWDRDNVKLNGVVFYPIESEDAEERTFRAGQLHITSTMPLAKVQAYREARSPFYNSNMLFGTFFLRLNVQKPPLNDVRVRRALSMAIDREKFVQDVMKAGQTAAAHLTPPGTAGFTSRAKVPFDVEGARKLLAEAGYPEGKGFPSLELLYNSTEANRLIAEALQQMWNRGLGINITMQNQEARVQNDTMRAGNYQIGRFAWIGDYLDPSTFLDLLTGDSANNMTHWRSADYDRIYAEANQTADNAKRYELFQQLEEILAQECPIIPVYFYAKNILRRPEVKGFYGNLLDQHPLKGVYLDPGAAGAQ